MKFKTNILLPIITTVSLFPTTFIATSCKKNTQQGFLLMNKAGFITGFNPNFSKDQILEHIIDSTLVIPKEAVGIANNAFFDVTKGGSLLSGLNIKHIKFEPQSACLSIGEQAFKYANEIESIELPPTLWAFGSESFKFCSKLASVNYTNEPLFPIVYGSSCFANCIFEQFNFPEKTFAILDHAFDRCIELTKIKFPESLDVISSYAFYGCKKLSEIDISSSHPQPDYIPRFPSHSNAFKGVSETGKIIYDSITQCEYSTQTGLPLHDKLHPKWWEYFYLSSNRIINEESWTIESKQ